MLDPPGGSGRLEWFYGEEADPVFEGMVKDFSHFNDALQAIHEKLEDYLAGVEELAEGLRALSEGVAASLARPRCDGRLASEGRALREATNQIALDAAPHSAVARLKRNMDFNVTAPIKEHLENNEKLRTEMEKRQRRLDELRSAKRQVDECLRRGLSETDARFQMARAEFEASQRGFRKVDRHVFEWLYILEEYRSDILDSSLQTLKYLQYEFFAASAHAISHTLPERMAFRPMGDMAPEHLEREVAELREAEGAEGLGLTAEGRGAVGSRFSARLVERLAPEAGGGGAAPAAAPVDALSLAALLAQGFEDAPARRALRLCGNDTQAALERLLRGDPAREPGASAGPRRPSRPLGRRRADGEASDGAAPRPTELGTRW